MEMERLSRAVVDALVDVEVGFFGLWCLWWVETRLG